MKRFLYKLTLIALIAVVLGEIIVRLFPFESDYPIAYKEKNGLIRYYSNQTGGYNDDAHQWKINKFGFFGPVPKSMDSLVLLFGDSFISNIMNPPECHQANYLEQKCPDFNFFARSRDGATFIELLEMSKSLEYLKPRFKLMYLSHRDFEESISEINDNKNSTQISLNSQKIRYAPLVNPTPKKFYHHFKLAKYLYTNFIKNRAAKAQKSSPEIFMKNINRIERLLHYAKKNYDCSNLIFVFHPNAFPEMVELVRKNGFKFIYLKTDNLQSWQLENDRHWSCFGHEEAALQVSKYLKKLE